MTTDAKALKARVRALVAARDYPAALELLEEVLDTCPEDVWVLDLLGFLYFMTGSVGRARQCCDRSIALSPNNFYAYKGLGLCLVRLGQIEPGISALERSIELNPRYFDSRHDLALVLIELGRLEPARRQLELALEIAPERAAQVRAVLDRIAALKNPPPP
jgi:tetratricopeptide (TPR) repeat protein